MKVENITYSMHECDILINALENYMNETSEHLAERPDFQDRYDLAEKLFYFFCGLKEKSEKKGNGLIGGD